MKRLKRCPCCGGPAKEQRPNLLGKTCITCSKCGLSTRWGSPEEAWKWWERRTNISRWINVQDDLPLTEGDVLVYRQSNEGTGVGLAGYINGLWHSSIDNWRWDDVTHWMPLPEELP